MKKLVLVFVVYFFVSVGFAQTNVDVLVRILDSLSTAQFDDWKYTTRFAQDRSEIARLSNSSYDDSDWQNLRLNQSIYVDSCWIRKKIVLPEFIAGHSVQGVIEFLVSVDDYGYLWVNGQDRGRFPWDGEFVLTEDAQSGQAFVLLIKAVNTGGPLRLLRSQLTSEHLRPFQESIQDFALSLRVGQKLLGFDTYQTNARVKTDPGTDRSGMNRDEKSKLNALLQGIVQEVDVDALRAGDYQQFTASLNRVRPRLKPVSEFAQRFTLTFDANAHIDAAWLWRAKETVEVCNRTFSSVINMMNVRPDFTYTQSQAALYAWMEAYYPDLFRQIQDRVEEGRWEVVGGMWVEPDCNLPDGVSWARHLLYGQRYFEKRVGKRAAIGWNPDSFGYTWNMPQFFRNAGIDVFITQKIGWNDTSVFPHRVFWWEAPDGSRILAYFPFNYVDTIENPFRLVDWLRQFEANTGFTNLLILFGVGDHGGGPSLDMLARIDRLQTLDIFPRIEYSTAEKYLNWLKTQDLCGLPVWDDELYLEYHRGTYTTQANTKRWNRRSETLLTNAEKFSTLGTLFDGATNSADLKTAWEIVLFNQFHDILPGSSIREVYHDADKSYRQVHAIGNHELTRSLEGIAKRIDTSRLGRGMPVVVFNPLAWERTDVVRIQLPEDDVGDYAVLDGRGKEVPSQTLVRGKYDREILFVAEKMPSLGYRTYVLRKQRPSSPKTHLNVSETFVENDFFRVTVDPDTGWVKSVFDKRNDREILTGSGNRLQLFEDKPTAWDAWNIGLGAEYPSCFRKIEIVEQGPVRAVLRVYRDFLKPGVTKEFPTEDFPTSFFTQDVILYSGIDRIDFRTDVEWWEDKTMLKVAFPVNVFEDEATYEIPYGFIRRSTTLERPLDKGKWEVPALRWADLSGGNYGVSLLNNSKYGYDVKGNVMRLSLLRSPIWPDPTADRGDHSIEYALYPHRGTWREARTVQRGYEFNIPLLALLTDSHPGELPASRSFVQLEPANLVLTSIKKAEDSDAWIVQWYDAIGKNTDGILTLPDEPEQVFTSNFLEGEGDPVGFEKNVVRVRTQKNGICTVKVVF